MENIDIAPLSTPSSSSSTMEIIDISASSSPSYPSELAPSFVYKGFKYSVKTRRYAGMLCVEAPFDSFPF